MAVVDEYGSTLPKIGAAVRVPDAPPPPDVPNAYANFTPTTSPGSVGPLAATRSTVPTREEFSTLVQGTRDDIVPSELAEDYRDAAKEAGDQHVKLKKIHAADHFDVITPTSPAWPKVLKAILKALD